ncbi:MAG: glutamine-hydrolyzing carbamoyl-phosphate synthase small subunit [Rubricoccaceae bacterium]|nr:glutamine-hydrolyzing carbamoyl-phosphate synthase small subunit [Rubricoccaceae bacterium]
MSDRPERIAKLALEDGTVLTGRPIGFTGETSGELCFNTSMSGYQEILTDPSYVGQLMMMTYPHIGNYGCFEDATEADRPMVSGLVVRAFSDQFSNAAAEESLDEYMKRFELVGITGIDTRKLVRHIRANGVMNAVVSSIDLDDESLIAKAKAVPSMTGLELASRVTVTEAYDFCHGEGPRIAVYDFGVKRNILRSFAKRDCTIRVFPAHTNLDVVRAWSPDGIFFSNGPGDPRAMPEAIDMVREATQTGIPLFGICLGHQLMALAVEMEVYKMKVGHRGANQPVLNLETGHVEITTQNHGFAVAGDSIDLDAASINHKNLNDGTIEGLRFKRFRGLSVQYHPEACPGPHDSRYLFDEFLNLIERSVEEEVVAS